MASVNCTTSLPSVNGLDNNVMTVGRHQLLSCEGEWEKSFDFTKPFFKVEENQKYTFKILKAEARSLSSFDVDMTIYGAGKYQIQDLIITDGTHEISLGPKQFEVASVIQKTQDGKPPEPFGPIMPLTLTWPPIYFIVLGVIVAAVVSSFVLSLRRRARLKRLLEGLKQYDAALAPDLQFYKTMRGLEKIDYPLAELEKAFRLYALRVFQLPLFDLNNRQAINFMKKRRPQYKKERLQLQKFLEEFEELAKKAENLTPVEKDELIKKMYRFVDHHIEAVR